jgi:hypothetical protein
MPDDAGRRTRADRVDRWLSLAAGFGALVAVGVALYQASLARAQLRAAAWPYVAQSNSYSGPGAAYTRDVENVGVGPARIRRFEVLVDGRPVPTWGAAVRALTDAPDSGVVYSSLGRGSVLPPGASRTLLRLAPSAAAGRFWAAAQTRLETVICYCSIYDECWNADSRLPEPAPVPACPLEPTPSFRQ